MTIVALYLKKVEQMRELDYHGFVIMSDERSLESPVEID
jgi:hypothetical protein